ncbi:unnamed protein product [Nippostrongylus brasiliensis]|uniref:Uncharacterized protein n=1 Tax=Nippostrongylus brasiliensis TaxID=27835 RepID=A0A0N4YD50_NIPBR|nr:unnamed protein product [Nippostrongylus brasiliensis]
MSVQLRRQIGATRQFLTHAVPLCQPDLQKNISSFISSSSHDTLLDYLEAIHVLRHTILAKFNKLEKLNDNWTQLMTADNNEVAVFYEYIGKYGDYRIGINAAIEILKTIDTHESLIIGHLAQQGVNYKFESICPNDQRQEADNHHSINELSNSQRHITPQSTTTQRGNTELNYFDASLLSRLDLPSFSGNLIEFPEFWSRYNTLVHSKTSLSAATKFSLLKSCLRGRKLQCVEGLPITDDFYSTAVDILHSTYDNPSCRGRHVANFIG